MSGFWNPTAWWWRLPARLALAWMSLPEKQLTRRGMMEIDDDGLEDLGLPRRAQRSRGFALWRFGLD